MFPCEAIWIGEFIKTLGLEKNRIVLDIGSSTENFRRVVQPHIDFYIFEPLRKQGLAVYHLDSKEAPGVDYVCDITKSAQNENFRAVPKADLVIAASLLEHVTDREAVLKNIETLVNPSGFLILTAPHVYPYHADPIDNGYRPSLRELRRNFKKIEYAVLKEKMLKVPRGFKKENYLTKAANKIFKTMGMREISLGVKDWYEVACIAVQKKPC